MGVCRGCPTRQISGRSGWLLGSTSLRPTRQTQGPARAAEGHQLRHQHITSTSTQLRHQHTTSTSTHNFNINTQLQHQHTTSTSTHNFKKSKFKCCCCLYKILNVSIKTKHISKFTISKYENVKCSKLKHNTHKHKSVILTQKPTINKHNILISKHQQIQHRNFKCLLQKKTRTYSKFQQENNTNTPKT